MSDEAGHVAEVLTPSEQDTISFYGQELIGVRLSDGRIAAVLRWLCEGLGINQQSQLRHIRGRKALAGGLVMVRVDTEGGPQAMPALTLDVLPGWLYSIDERRVRPEVQDSVVLFQQECTKALANHFAKKQATLAAPTSLVPAEPITQPDYPPSGSSPDVWLQYHRQMIAFLEWQQDIEEWRSGVEDRLETVEELSRLVPELLERLGPTTLSPEHQHTIQVSVKRLHELSGIAYSTIYSDLNASFHVGRYSDILESSWLDVSKWFQMRIAAAEKREKEDGRRVGRLV